MGEESKLSKLYFRKRENWFKELLYKIKILKPKYKELGKIIETKKIKSCEMCVKKKTMECPNSSLCYNKENRPYFKSRLERSDT